MIFNGVISSMLSTFIGNRIRKVNNLSIFSYGLAGGAVTGFFGDYLNRYFEQQIYVQLVWKNPEFLKGIRFESTVF